jgi:hypothetical protein
MMNPRTHPRGAPPDFAMPSKNPNPSRMTDALWWLVTMRQRLEPKGRNGGTYANKPGSHNVGSALRDRGQGNPATDHSIRDRFNRTGPWWRSKTAAHDWTFVDAQAGRFTTITRYTRRLVNAMRDPRDPRPDNTYFYTLGQLDDDRVVEGYNEADDAPETSGDATHLWHRHDSFRRDIVGSFPHMWQALTIDMGWTVAEWRQSLEEDVSAKDVWQTDGLIDNWNWRPDFASNPKVTASWAVWLAAQQAHNAAVDARAGRLTAEAILQAVQGVDDEGILARIEELAAQTSRLPEEIIDALVDAGRPAEQVADALRGLLGARAGEVGRLLMAADGTDG